MHQIVFIGSSHKGLRILCSSEFFEVQKAMCLSSRVTNSLKDLCIELGIELIEFSGIKHFTEEIRKFPTTMPFFIYQLDMLVPESLTRLYRFYNLHRGDLMENRGPSPDVWPVLLGFSSTKLSLHKINEKIDSGVLIASYPVSVLENEDPFDIKTKLEVGIPYLIEQLDKHLNGEIEGIVLENGTYRPWVTESDFTIDFEADGFKEAKRKIISQRRYNGAIVKINGEKQYVVEISDYPIFRKNESLQVSLEGKKFFLKLNKEPLIPPPPKRPKSKRI